jgi:hypothetical protein
MIKKIRSGAQSGADQAGLYAAELLGIETGGWITKGGRTEFGPLPLGFKERFHLIETPSSDYPQRTKYNVRDSDGTAWFGKTGSAGYICTAKACLQYKKEIRVIHEIEDLIEFIDLYDIKELNVAGNRESHNPGIWQRTFDIIVAACNQLKTTL